MPAPRHLILTGLIGLLALAAAGGMTWVVLKERHQRELDAAAAFAEQHKPAFGTPRNAANVAVPWDTVIEELHFQEQKVAVAPVAVSPEEAPIKPEEITPLWMANAAPPPALPAGAKRVAIVLDDMGVNVEQTEKALTLPPEITFAFLPYGRGTSDQAKRARDLGHEIMVHLPMEPLSRSGDEHGTNQIDPGPNALFTTLDAAEIISRTEVNLHDLLPLVVGINNHMGSRFTGNKEGMRPVLETAQKYGLFFMDSLTTGKSQVKEAAEGLTLPLLERNIFIDHYSDKDHLMRALAQIERHAQTHGQAIAIGHPHQGTLDVLNAWVPTLAEKGIYLVPITDMIRQAHQNNDTPQDPNP